MQPLTNFLLCCFPLSVLSIEINEELSWSLGKLHSIGWYFYISDLVVSLVLNCFNIYLLGYKAKIRGIVLANLVFALSMIDAIMSLQCLVQCLINLTFKRIVGNISGCQSQALIVSSFSFWEAWVLAIIAYTLERKVCAGVEFADNTRAVKLVVISGIVACTCGALCVYLPKGGYYMMSSGTYCFLRMYEPVAGGGFALSIIVPTLIMAHRYYKIWACVTKAQQVLSDHGLQVRAKARYTDMAKKMSLFIFTFFGTAVPFLICAVYEWATAQYAPAWLDILAGTSLHTTSIINPVLFFTLNDDVRELLWEEYGVHVLLCFGYKGTAKIARIQPCVNVECAFKISSKYSAFEEEKEVETWLNDKYKAEIFQKWCDANYVSENYLFYKDAENYKMIGERLRALLTNYFIDCSENDVKLKEIADLGNEMFERAQFIYDMYIKIPTAPLEVNIPGTVRMKIYRSFDLVGDAVKWDKSTIIQHLPSFPAFVDLPATEAMESLDRLSQAYKEAMKIISKLIATDIFPRFRKSNEYLEYCGAMRNSGRNLGTV